MRLVPLVLLVLPVVACDRSSRRAPPVVVTQPDVVVHLIPGDAGVMPSTLASALDQASEDDDEEPTAAPVKADAGCTQALLRPGYCRRRCRTFSTREFGMHARRIAHPLRAGTGTCGAFQVFAADDVNGGGIVEYYSDGALFGARDTRGGCVNFGDVPSCKPTIKWRP
jgi:hypothetical protein